MIYTVVFPSTLHFTEGRLKYDQYKTIEVGEEDIKKVMCALYKLNLPYQVLDKYGNELDKDGLLPFREFVSYLEKLREEPGEILLKYLHEE
jgi:hypothetical protein